MNVFGICKKTRDQACLFGCLLYSTKKMAKEELIRYLQDQYRKSPKTLTNMVENLKTHDDTDGEDEVDQSLQGYVIVKMVVSLNETPRKKRKIEEIEEIEE